MRKSKIAILACITAGLCILVGVQSARATPTWLPPDTELAGYKIIWNNQISVESLAGDGQNVTCYTQIWYKNGTNTTNPSIIGTSMLDKGGNYFERPIDYDSLGTFQKLGLQDATGLNATQLAGVNTIWDLMVAVLIHGEGENVNISQPAIPGVNRALMMEAQGQQYFNYAILATQGSYVMVAFNLDWEDDWTTWILAENNTQAVLTAFQAIVYWYWIKLAVVVTVLGWLTSNLNLSEAPVASPDPSSSGIYTSGNTDIDEMKSFITAWGSQVMTFIPGYEVAIIAAVSAATAGAVALKIKRSRKRDKK